MLLGSLLLLQGYVLTASQRTPPDDLQSQVRELKAEVEQLKQQQGIPSTELNRYRKSIGYIYGVYKLGFGSQLPKIREGFSGTGFLVGDGLVATNRHIAEPWYKDSEAQALIDRGATPVLESLVIFFPSLSNPVRLSHARFSKTSDLAILRIEDTDAVHTLPILPLAKLPTSAGQLVTVIGYPMGMAGMIAKSPSGIAERLPLRHDGINAARELAAHQLIRPSTTFGHVGDVVGDKLIYDAPTAHGGSGGPVFNAQGEVIGVNSGFISEL